MYLFKTAALIEHFLIGSDSLILYLDNSEGKLPK